MKTILIIEDNDDIRENTCELLELEGYLVLTATDGLTGITAAQEWLPDIIFCDIMMPLADGFEVFRTLKELQPTAAIPFVFLTANAEKREMESGMSLGADGYICKPFSPEELLATLGCCLISTAF
jgi:CheY-like chemotaxis protein